jgi:hypothetical protein
MFEKTDIAFWLTLAGSICWVRVFGGCIGFQPNRIPCISETKSPTMGLLHTPSSSSLSTARRRRFCDASDDKVDMLAPELTTRRIGNQQPIRLKNIIISNTW